MAGVIRRHIINCFIYGFADLHPIYSVPANLLYKPRILSQCFTGFYRFLKE